MFCQHRLSAAAVPDASGVGQAIQEPLHDANRDVRLASVDLHRDLASPGAACLDSLLTGSRRHRRWPLYARPIILLDRPPGLVDWAANASRDEALVFLEETPSLGCCGGCL